MKSMVTEQVGMSTKPPERLLRMILIPEGMDRLEVKMPKIILQRARLVLSLAKEKDPTLSILPFVLPNAGRMTQASKMLRS